MREKLERQEEIMSEMQRHGKRDGENEREGWGERLTVARREQMERKKERERKAVRREEGRQRVIVHESPDRHFRHIDSVIWPG